VLNDDALDDLFEDEVFLAGLQVFYTLTALSSNTIHCMLQMTLQKILDPHQQ
jgi:hypothetical protein